MADDGRGDKLWSAVERVAAAGGSPRERAAALRDLALALGRRVPGPGVLADAVLAAAPRLAGRDLATLRAQTGGLSGRELAAELTRGAVRLTGAIGAAGGALATASEAAPAALVTAPVQLAAETLAVVVVELRLVAELHAALGVPLPADGAQRAAVVLRAWMGGRGVNLAELTAGGGAAALLGGAGRRQLRRMLLRRFARSGVGFLPLLAGAAAGATINARGTRRLADGLVASLVSP